MIYQNLELIMRNLNTLVILFAFLFSATTAFSQASVSAKLSYGSFNYDISDTKYTGDGGVVHLDGQLSSSVNYSLSISDGKFDDVVYNNSEGSVTYTILPNIGVDFMLLNIADEGGVNSSMTDVFGVAATGLEYIPPRQFMVRIRREF